MYDEHSLGENGVDGMHRVVESAIGVNSAAASCWVLLGQRLTQILEGASLLKGCFNLLAFFLANLGINIGSVLGSSSFDQYRLFDAEGNENRGWAKLANKAFEILFWLEAVKHKCSAAVDSEQLLKVLEYLRERD